MVPLGLHKSMKDSSISGRFVPKDTQVWFNLWNLHHDPAEWENPEQFNPHRWLDEELSANKASRNFFTARDIK